MASDIQPRRVQRQPSLQEFHERRDFIWSPSATRLRRDDHKLRQRVYGVAFFKRHWRRPGGAFADEVRDVRTALAGAVQIQ